MLSCRTEGLQILLLLEVLDAKFQKQVSQEIPDHLDVVTLGAPLLDDGPLLAVVDDGRACLLPLPTLPELLLAALLFVAFLAHDSPSKARSRDRYG